MSKKCVDWNSNTLGMFSNLPFLWYYSILVLPTWQIYNKSVLAEYIYIYICIYTMQLLIYSTIYRSMMYMCSNCARILLFLTTGIHKQVTAVSTFCKIYLLTRCQISLHILHHLISNFCTPGPTKGKVCSK